MTFFLPRLLIKSAVLPAGKEGETVVVQLEAEGYNKAKVVVPVVAMRGGRDLQTYVDLLVPSQARLVLVQGEGPVTLVGSHCVDYQGFLGQEDLDEEEDELEEEDIKEEAENLKEKKKTPVKGKPAGDGDEKKSPMVKEDSKKRKASEEKTSSQEKKAKSKASPAK